MIDYRHETFCALCQIKSYTKTAEALHITQPAVSQHIRYLETYYGGKLFEYKEKKLSLTLRGEKLYGFLKTMLADEKRIKALLNHLDNTPLPLVFGATLTIAEYVMPPILGKILRQYPTYRITMKMDNTSNLLKKLQEGMIDFAILEGHFDKSDYGSKILSHEKFVSVCSPISHLAGKTVSFDEITQERLILREEGSGTREVFNQAIKSHNYSINCFSSLCEIENMQAIKQLVSQNLGISFMYCAAAQQELKEGTLAEFYLENFDIAHEFNYVFLKNTQHEADQIRWFNLIDQAAHIDSTQPQ